MGDRRADHATKASGYHVDDRAEFTHRGTRTDAVPPGLVATADFTYESQERLVQETKITDHPSEFERHLTQKEPNTTQPQGDLEYHGPMDFGAISRPAKFSPSIQYDSIASLIAELPQVILNQKLNTLAILLGTLPCVWYLSRVILITYLPVLNSTPPLASIAFILSSPGPWFMARTSLVPQKIRLMSFIASAGNWVILSLELCVFLYYIWLRLTDDMCPWKNKDVLCQAEWISFHFFIGCIGLFFLITTAYALFLPPMES